ncbi:MAG: ATP-dependent DNA helicase [Magnetococcales bacterium]|nr:ATP-dependent DNA helicase [Magnetococcales bacterium]
MSSEIAAIIERLFGEESSLASRLRGYEVRPSQYRMAERVLAAAHAEETILVEAGTGTGKTLSYMLPLLETDVPFIVSTATRTLQDQIHAKDLPLLRSVVSRPFNAAVLKGRNNYLCRHKFGLYKHQSYLVNYRDQRHFAILQEWANTTTTGDRDEVDELPEHLEMWHQVSTHGDDCLGQSCPDFETCYLYLARNRARNADLVVVNHHLFFADLSLKEEGFGEILPPHKVVVFDEAHRLPEVATLHFGLELSNYQLRELASDALREWQEVGIEDPRILASMEKLEESGFLLRSAFYQGNSRDTLTESSLNGAPGRALIQVEAALHGFREIVEPHLQRSAGLAACGRRAETMLTTSGILRSLEDPERVYWYETRGKGVFLQASPLETGPLFQEALYPRLRSTIFTSATLTTSQSSGGFSYTLGLLGCDPESTVCDQLPQEFDFSNNTLLYVPNEIVEPDDSQFPEQCAREIEALIRASSGRALCLFTSHRMMGLVFERLDGKVPFPLLCQGERPKRSLLERFQEVSESVLFGVGAFWEGVDVPGDALSMVIVDRLPFPSPGDPLVSARTRLLESRGQRAFPKLFLPQAILTLKQGLGRLIRRKDDRGVMVVLDRRLADRPYGRRFLNGLPPVPVTRNLNDVAHFFETPHHERNPIDPDDTEHEPQRGEE